MPHPLFMPDTLCDNVLLFDGITRSGKMLVAPLVSDLPKVDYAQNVMVIDYIPMVWGLGHMDTHSTAMLLRQTVDGCTYERAVGRHLNTRRDDVYAVHRSLDGDKILERSAGDEGWPAINRFNNDGRISSFISHYTLPMAEPWFIAFPKLRILLTVRHPIDVIYSCRSRGWGDRWGKDPLGFTVTADIEGSPVPWFALEFTKEYQRLTPVNRVVKCILSLIQVYDVALAALDETQPGQVEVACFERMGTDPVAELERLAGWLDTTLHPDMETAMKRERVPRQLDINDRQDKLRQLESEIEPDLMDQLLAAGRDYETRWGLESL